MKRSSSLLILLALAAPALGQSPTSGPIVVVGAPIYSSPIIYPPFVIAPRYPVYQGKSAWGQARYQQRREMIRYRAAANKAKAEGRVGYEIIWKPISP